MSYCFILRNSRNIFVKTASFYLERLQGYGVLKKMYNIFGLSYIYMNYEIDSHCPNLF